MVFQFQCTGANENGLILEPFPGPNYPATITVGGGCLTFLGYERFTFLGDNGYHTTGHFAMDKKAVRWDNAGKHSCPEHSQTDTEGELWVRAC